MNPVSWLRRKVNNRLLGYSYKFRLARLPARLPDSLDIETTNQCSLHCFKCPRKDMGRPGGSMSFDLFRKIADDAAPEVSFCWLHLFGEPLLNRQLPRMIAYAGSRGIKCGISTNAIALTEETGRALCDAGLDILIISLDAVEKETYDKIRPGGDFGKVVDNTERFLALPGTGKIREIVIQMIRFDENKDEVGRFIAKWKGAGRKVHVKEEESWAGYLSLPGKGREITRYPCPKLWHRLTIDWQGDVSICCRDYKMSEKVGNVATESLSGIWNGKRMVALRKKMARGEYGAIPLCKNCPDWINFSSANFAEY